jgi:hypothetical protein
VEFPGEQVTVKLGFCGEYAGLGPLWRVRYDLGVRVLAARDGALVAKKTFKGSAPDACPITYVYVPGFGPPDELGGNQPSMSPIRDYLSGFVGSLPD